MTGLKSKALILAKKCRRIITIWLSKKGTKKYLALFFLCIFGIVLLLFVLSFKKNTGGGFGNTLIEKLKADKLQDFVTDFSDDESTGPDVNLGKQSDSKNDDGNNSSVDVDNFKEGEGPDKTAEREIYRIEIEEAQKKVAKDLSLGKLTSEQSNLLNAKLSEILSYYDSLEGKNKSEAKYLARQNQIKVRRWAEENNLPVFYVDIDY